MTTPTHRLQPLIDTHCHLNLQQYDDDRADVLQRAHAAGVKRVIIPAIDTKTAREALLLADGHPGEIFAAVGVHPNSTADFSADTLQAIERLSYQAGAVAIGEIGLDYHWDESPKAKQADAFEQQLELAAQRELPVIIHNREAHNDVLPILERWAQHLPEALQSRPGVLHSFSAPAEIAERALAAGFCLGFTGPITFKKADDLRAIAKDVPLDRILVETDGPYLTPHPYRGKRNEPAYIPYIVEKLAEVKGLTVNEVAQASTENAMRLFALPEVV
jgi:TatD DNase family protein